MHSGGVRWAFGLNGRDIGMRSVTDPTQYLGTCPKWMADAFYTCGCPWFGRHGRISGSDREILAQIQEFRAADMERWWSDMDLWTLLTHQNPSYVSHVGYEWPLRQWFDVLTAPHTRTLS